MSNENLRTTAYRVRNAHNPAPFEQPANSKWIEECFPATEAVTNPSLPEAQGKWAPVVNMMNSFAQASLSTLKQRNDFSESNAGYLYFTLPAAAALTNAALEHPDASTFILPQTSNGSQPKQAVFYDWDCDKARVNTAEMELRSNRLTGIYDGEKTNTLPTDPGSERMQVKVGLTELDPRDLAKLESSRLAMETAMNFSDGCANPSKITAIQNLAANALAYLGNFWESRLSVSYVVSYYDAQRKTVDSETLGSVNLLLYPDRRVGLEFWTGNGKDPQRIAKTVLEQGQISYEDADSLCDAVHKSLVFKAKKK